MSVRPWDHQLRQAMLLATPNAVIASAPVEGFLHQINALDTLGDDEPETPCKLQQVSSTMRLVHAARALRAVTTREIVKFVQQRGRLFSALVRPAMWLAVFAAGFYNVFGVSIIPPYKTYITYQVYIVPGLLGIILLFHGMQSRSRWSMTARWA